MQLELSSEIKNRNLKIMFWGKTATRKTETILRNFPGVLLIDTEGNSDQCVGVPSFVMGKGCCGARGGRTLTMSPSTDFKSVASADSAIAPSSTYCIAIRQNKRQKIP